MGGLVALPGIRPPSRSAGVPAGAPACAVCAPASAPVRGVDEKSGAGEAGCCSSCGACDLDPALIAESMRGAGDARTSAWKLLRICSASEEKARASGDRNEAGRVAESWPGNAVAPVSSLAAAAAAAGEELGKAAAVGEAAAIAPPAFERAGVERTAGASLYGESPRTAVGRVGAAGDPMDEYPPGDAATGARLAAGEVGCDDGGAIGCC